MRIVLYLQVILPVQDGLSLIRRSPVPPDAVIESKVGIYSLWAFLGKFWLLSLLSLSFWQGQGQNNIQEFDGKNLNMGYCDQGFSSLELSTFSISSPGLH